MALECGSLREQAGAWQALLGRQHLMAAVSYRPSLQVPQCGPWCQLRPLPLAIPAPELDTGLGSSWSWVWATPPW